LKYVTIIRNLLPGRGRQSLRMRNDDTFILNLH
jgi:hypothetical protein